ncbi:MAG TPA: hypothetical protein VGP02_13510 [Mycobacteriales bacterium]|nr:hypothetical protein [Mycobacteriales bacterium]
MRPDLGLLAEYAEGLLDGTPQGAAVARRLEAEPDWAGAYAALAAALPEVRADLAGLGDPGPVPADVAARLEAGLSAVSLPRRRSWRAASGAAAAVVALVAGLSAVWPAETVDPGTSVRATRPSQVGRTVVTYTGEDHAPTGSLHSLSSPGGGPPPRVAPELSRLSSRTALVDCLDAIQRATSTGPPRFADFGRYAGRPALVVELTTDPPRTVVAGPRCGTAGADLLARPDGPR